MQMKKHYTGCYRINNGGENFGQVAKMTIGNKWVAEIRDVDTGEIVRYAGSWNTRKEAVEEVEFLLNR